MRIKIESNDYEMIFRYICFKYITSAQTYDQNGNDQEFNENTSISDQIATINVCTLGHAGQCRTFLARARTSEV